MEKKLNFDRLREEDLKEVANLYDAERPCTTNYAKMEETFSKIKDNKDYHMIVVKYEDIIVGFAKVTIHHDIFEENKPFITIWSVRVKKEYRRKKIGTRLFEYIEKLAKEMDCGLICLIATKENVVANEFYKKLGYKCENGYVKFLE